MQHGEDVLDIRTRVLHVGRQLPQRITRFREVGSVRMCFPRVPRQAVQQVSAWLCTYISESSEVWGTDANSHFDRGEGYAYV
jgi:hypothetical protein